jgi:hypothetical protein
MTYYSCLDLKYFADYSTIATRSLIAIACGPSEIRTRDLLNAIETRSQLRYGPMYGYSKGSKQKAGGGIACCFVPAARWLWT